MNHHRKYAAFTLVEISIVMVIISLLVTAVLAASGMIKRVKLKSIITDLYKYEGAINSFKTKYGYWPGDFPNAYVTFNNPSCINAQCEWVYTGNVKAGSATSSSGCNCDGDGIVRVNDGNANDEFLLVWQHLSLANIIDGAYNATTAGTAGSLPQGRYNSGYYSLQFMNFNSSSVMGHALVYSGLSGTMPNANVLSTQDAYIIDQMMDDGLPGSGKLFGVNLTVSTDTGCPITTSLPSTSAIYDQTISSKQYYCSLVFWVERNI